MRTRPLVGPHQHEHEQDRRKQEAPGRPERVVAPFRPGNDATDDGAGDGENAPDDNDFRHVAFRYGAPDSVRRAAMIKAATVAVSSAFARFDHTRIIPELAPSARAAGLGSVNCLLSLNEL